MTIGPNFWTQTFIMRSVAGTLAALDQLSDGLTYLRLSEYLAETATGQENSGEPCLINGLFDASVANSSTKWKVLADSGAVDSNHYIFPMVCEYAQAGPDFMNWEHSPSGVSEVNVGSGGTSSPTTISVTWTTIHELQTVVVTPGSKVQFYVDGSLVATVTTNVPTSKLVRAAELNTNSTTGTKATLWVFGELLD